MMPPRSAAYVPAPAHPCPDAKSLWGPVVARMSPVSPPGSQKGTSTGAQGQDGEVFPVLSLSNTPSPKIVRIQLKMSMGIGVRLLGGRSLGLALLLATATG